MSEKSACAAPCSCLHCCRVAVFRVPVRSYMAVTGCRSSVVCRQRHWTEWLARAEAVMAQQRPYVSVEMLSSVRDDGLALPLLNVFASGGNGGTCPAWCLAALRLDVA